MFKNEKGSAIIVTLIVMFVITLLGFTLWNYNMAEAKFAERELNRTKAHYLARSGVETVAGYIIENSEIDIVDDIADGNIVTSEPTYLGEGHFTISISMNDEEVLIEGIGEVNGITDRVTLTLVERIDSFEAMFNRAIYSVADLDISHTNARVYGDVESKGTVTGEPETGEIFANSTRTFHSPVPPDRSNLCDVSNISTNSQITIDSTNYDACEGIYIDEVDIKPQGKLTVNVPEGETFVMKVHKYFNKGSTEVVGGGAVILFITHSAELQTPHAMSPESLMVILADGTSSTLRANGEFNGYIYGPNATTIMQSAWSTVNGAIITGGMYGNLNHARFMGTVTHEIREIFDMETLGSFIPTSERFEKNRWGN